jgi:DNA-binding CsgD family transcriptional regulator
VNHEDIEQALDACYEAVASPEAWRPALDRMCGALDAAAIMFYPKDLNADSAPVPVSEAYGDFLPDFIAGGWYDGHYRSERGWPLLRQRGSTVLIEHELATDEERKFLPHYNELYLPKGYPGFAAIGFNIGVEQWAMCVLRDHKQGFFTPEEAERMAPLAGHFRRMVRLAERFETGCIATNLSALEAQERPAAVLAKDGRICSMNGLCEHLLQRSADGLIVQNGRFVALAPDGNRSLQSLIHAVTMANHGRRRAAHTEKVAVPRPGRLPILVEALSMAALGMEHSLYANAMLTFYDPERQAVPDEAAYMTAFGLTPSEAKLATALVTGQALDQAAEKLSITRETARQRLKTVFAKTDTHRQGELISLLGRVSN